MMNLQEVWHRIYYWQWMVSNRTTLVAIILSTV